MASDNSSLSAPDYGAIHQALERFGRELFAEGSEDAIAETFVRVVRDVLPDRLVLLRVVELRNGGRPRIYGSDAYRFGLDSERITLHGDAARRYRLKEAVAVSALLRESSRWDSPFNGVAEGLAIPVTSGGELMGLLDIGYPLGVAGPPEEESRLQPLVILLGSALRAERLSHEAQSLRDYQARLIDHARALILGIDESWRIRVCNRALSDLLGVSSSELIGKDVRDDFPAVDRGQLTRLFADGMKGSDGAVGETELATADGKRIPVVWRTAAIRHRGQVHALVAVGQDQTVLSDLQKQLIQAEKMSTLGQIAAGVVHELNNPLTAIGVYSDALLRRFAGLMPSTVSDEERDSLQDAQEKLHRIRSSVERIQLFARDLMHYARPSSGMPEVIPINHVVLQGLSFCQHLFSQRNVDLHRELDEASPKVRAVPGQLEQVVVNLLTNAVQACGPKGTVRVTTKGADGEVVFSVIDRGPGISRDMQERIFEPFFTTKRDGEGTGLGLSIVRNIINENHGQLELLSEEGVGTEFRCTLPRAD